MTTRSRADDLETTKNTLVSTSENVAKSCPTFPESPALPWFGHLIPEDGIVDAVDVKISWNQIYIGDDEGVIFGSFRIKDVAVNYLPIRLLTDPDHPLIKRINCFDDRHFRCTHGNVWSDWKDEDLKAATWKIWDDLCYVGFLNDDEAKRARMEFARIRECEWARDVGFEIPKGVPWTDDDRQALAPARKQMRKWKEQRDELGLPKIKAGQINKAPPVGSSFSPIERPPAYGGFSVCDPSQLEGRDVPDREWLVENLIPAGKVVLFTGDGGVGKSLAMQQLCTATALGQDWFGIPTQACRSFGLFCEDDDEELHRRQADICAHTMTPLWELWRMRWLSGVGLDNTLMQFDQRTGDAILTPLFHQLLEFLGNFKPGLVVVDTLADTFGGNEIIRNQVRTFINGCLGSICEETSATVVLCGHPSRAGLKDGDGYSGSTAWHASVRARLYLSKPDDESAAGRG